MPALQLTADEHLSRRIDAVNLKHRLGDVETDCRDRLHAWLPITATAPAAITSMALTRRCGSRPQHQNRTPSHTEVPTQIQRQSTCVRSGFHYWRRARNMKRESLRLLDRACTTRENLSDFS